VRLDPLSGNEPRDESALKEGREPSALEGATSEPTRRLLAFTTVRSCNRCRTGRLRRNGIRVDGSRYSSWTSELLCDRLHVGLQTDNATPGAALHLAPAGILASMNPTEPLTDNSRAPIEVLLENHRAFLRYLQSRVNDRELAEDILQDAFVKVMDRPDHVPADEGLVPWFYRTLRNAAIDRFRRRDSAGRAVEAFARELQTNTAPEPEIEAEICACIARLASTLKEEYADALQAIDVQGTAVKAFAEQRGLSASNAGVRIFRAREALKKRLIESCGTCAEHGCQNCTCQTRC
jgi:RNA polymerase sigma factor (sigma-70 family)